MPKSFLAGIIIFSLIVIGGSYLLVSGGKQNTPRTKPLTYQTKDKDRPRIQVKETFKNMGEMKVSDQKTEDFLVKNVGSKPLQLSNISSSCGCTVGQIIIDGKTSEEFGMHSQSDYIAEINPGKEAIVKVTYRPYVMPVYGPVDREVYMTTNDPENPNLIFKVKAVVK